MMSEEHRTKAQFLQELEILCQSICELEQAEKTLRLSKKQFHELFENTLEGIYITIPDSRIIMSNLALVRMLVYSSFQELSQQDLKKDGFAFGYLCSMFKVLIERQRKAVDMKSVWLRRDGHRCLLVKMRESSAMNLERLFITEE